jgi:hypothetical protein
VTTEPSDRIDPSAPAGATAATVRAWVVQDTGLAPAPPRHRRLPGALRHHQGEGPVWPAEVLLRIDGEHLEVGGLGRWPLTEVSAEVVQTGPPVVFSLAVPGARQLLAAPSDASTASLLDGLARR